MTKAALRKTYRAARNAIPAEEHRRLSARACARVEATSAWQAAKTVLLYSPLGSELDVRPLAEAARRAGKAVALPRCEEEPRSLSFFRVDGADQMAPGAWGIREPIPERCERIPPEAIDLAVIPVVAMDIRGFRLGNGGGYYDRVMDRLRLPVLIGFEEQLAERLPREAHDRPARGVVTPEQTIGEV